MSTINTTHQIKTESANPSLGISGEAQLASTSYRIHESRRLALVTNVYAIGIVLVVAGHSIPSPRFAPGRDSDQLLICVFDWIYSFHMPLFFWLAGVTFCLSHPPAIFKRLPDYILERATRLLVPYLILNTCAFPLRVFMSRHSPHRLERVADFSFSVTTYLRSLLYPWKCSVTFLWFLPTLFIVCCLAPIMLAATRAKPPVMRTVVQILITASTGLLSLTFSHRDAIFGDTVLNYGGVLHYLFYFWLGLWMAERKTIARVERLTSRATIYFCVAFCSLHSMAFIWIRHVRMLESLGPVMVLGVTGIAMSVGFARVMSLSPTKLGAELSKYCYQIYLLSWFVQIPSLVITAVYLKLPTRGCACITFAIGITLPLALSRLMDARAATRLSCLGFGKERSPNAKS